MFSWFKRHRRRSLLAEPMPAGWTAILERMPHVRALPAAQRQAHQDATRIFVAEKTFVGVDGLLADDAKQVVIAALASILTLGLDDFHFDNVATILIAPSVFLGRRRASIGMEAVIEEDEEHLGEAHYRGPVKLSWEAIEEDINEPWGGFNLVFHEFAHQLDMLNGEADGVPSLAKELREPWEKVMGREFEALQRAVKRRKETVLDPYGAGDPAEFFAVAVEAFFDAPRDLRERHGELYDLLRRYFGQDPAEWRLPSPPPAAK